MRGKKGLTEGKRVEKEVEKVRPRWVRLLLTLLYVFVLMISKVKVCVDKQMKHNKSKSIILQCNKNFVYKINYRGPEN